MNSFTQLVQNVKDANWQGAGQVFKEIMQQKVADRIAIERQTIFNEDGSEAYKQHFDSMLKKWNVSSPADIPDDKKDDFFKAVDDGYSAKNEVAKRGPVNWSKFKPSTLKALMQITAPKKKSKR